MESINLALSMQGVSKRFPGMLAVDNVDLDLHAGEVHAIMGENGAGKSTLMKIITGSFSDYTGVVKMGGRPVALHSPAAAKEYGIGMVYQELSLAPPISIAENLLAGRLPAGRLGLLDRKAMAREARHCLSEVGLDVDPFKTVEELSQHEAQLVEIAKVLGNRPCILIMDEPTSALSQDEVQRLFSMIRHLKNRGLAIVYISHHLPEVFEIADKVTVMRDGRKIATKEIHELTPRSLVQMMVGQDIDEFYRHREAKSGWLVLQVNNLTRLGFFHDVSFELHSGEILGIAGLSGSGRTELARSLCGLDPVDAGQVFLENAPLKPANYPDTLQRGLVYLTEDRKQEGLFLRLSVRRNVIASIFPLLTRFGIYRPEKETAVVRRWSETLGIAAASPDVGAGTLSGGNQQKVLLGKCLATNPEVLILDEPSRGVDVGAKRKIHEAVMALADSGAAVLLISSDLPELAGLSSRALILRNGRLLGILEKAELSEESLLLAANGHWEPSHA